MARQVETYLSIPHSQEEVLIIFGAIQPLIRAVFDSCHRRRGSRLPGQRISAMAPLCGMHRDKGKQRASQKGLDGGGHPCDEGTSKALMALGSSGTQTHLVLTWRGFFLAIVLFYVQSHVPVVVMGGPDHWQYHRPTIMTSTIPTLAGDFLPRKRRCRRVCRDLLTGGSNGCMTSMSTTSTTSTSMSMGVGLVVAHPTPLRPSSRYGAVYYSSAWGILLIPQDLLNHGCNSNLGGG